MTIQPHVAIFITDYAEAYADKHGTFGDMTTSLLKSSGLTNEIKPYDVIKSKFPTDKELENIKAIWITGSRSDAFADEEWILNLRDFLREKIFPQKIPVIGICFGHQIIARALGSKVGRNDKGWELGIEQVNVNQDPEIKELLSDFKDGEFEILEVHQDMVFQTPEGFKNIGSSKRTQSQGFYKKGKVLTFQGHPEFTKSLVKDILESKLKSGSLTQQHFDEAVQAMDKYQHDGPTIGKTIVKFINEAE